MLLVFFNSSTYAQTLLRSHFENQKNHQNRVGAQSPDCIYLKRAGKLWALSFVVIQKGNESWRAAATTVEDARRLTVRSKPQCALKCKATRRNGIRHTVTTRRRPFSYIVVTLQAALFRAHTTPVCVCVSECVIRPWDFLLQANEITAPGRHSSTFQK